MADLTRSRHTPDWIRELTTNLAAELIVIAITHGSPNARRLMFRRLNEENIPIHRSFLGMKMIIFSETIVLMVSWHHDLFYLRPSPSAIRELYRNDMFGGLLSLDESNQNLFNCAMRFAVDDPRMQNYREDMIRNMAVELFDPLQCNELVYRISLPLIQQTGNNFVCNTIIDPAPVLLLDCEDTLTTRITWKNIPYNLRIHLYPPHLYHLDDSMGAISTRLIHANVAADQRVAVRVSALNDSGLPMKEAEITRIRIFNSRAGIISEALEEGADIIDFPSRSAVFAIRSIDEGTDNTINFASRCVIFPNWIFNVMEDGDLKKIEISFLSNQPTDKDAPPATINLYTRNCLIYEPSELQPPMLPPIQAVSSEESFKYLK